MATVDGFSKVAPAGDRPLRISFLPGSLTPPYIRRQQRTACAAMPGEQAIQRELISGHVQSLLPSHLTDVTTSNEHTIKPWFNGKLDASPPVVDLMPLTARLRSPK